MKKLHVKYSKAYKAALKESLLAKHQELYGRQPWFQRFKFFRWTLAPALVLVLVFTLPFSANPTNFLNEAHAAQLALIAEARDKIIHETLQFVPSGDREERWTAPNGDHLTIQKSPNLPDNIFLGLPSKQQAFTSYSGFLQPVLFDKRLELQTLQNINAFYYANEEQAFEYAKITTFLDEANIFEAPNFTLWLQQNLDSDLVKYLGKKGKYHAFEVRQPALNPMMATEKNYQLPSVSTFYFNSETSLLEHINHNNRSYTTISVEMIAADQYENIFTPTLYSLTETEFLQ